LVPLAAAQAGFFGQVVRFLTGELEAQVAQNQSGGFASVSYPLLGSQTPPAAPVREGTGGPLEEEHPFLVVYDSALVAPLNPLGTIPGDSAGQIIIYRVEKGDTPGAIASRFGISLNTLLWANNLRGPNLIKAGDELVILPVSGIQYEVKRGDTLDGIIRRFKPKAVDEEGELSSFKGDVLSFNGLAVNEILEPGRVLIIPDGEIAVVVAPIRPETNPSGQTVFQGLKSLKGYFMRPIFGGRKSRGLHGYNGIDLADSCGLPVVASAEGTIILARDSGWNGGYGKYLVMTHPNGTQTLYAHLSLILGRVGQKVAQGSQIAAIGSSGNSTGCHLHFEVRGAKNPF